MVTVCVEALKSNKLNNIKAGFAKFFTFLFVGVPSPLIYCFNMKFMYSLKCRWRAQINKLIHTNILSLKEPIILRGSSGYKQEGSMLDYTNPW